MPMALVGSAAVVNSFIWKHSPYVVMKSCDLCVVEASRVDAIQSRWYRHSFERSQMYRLKAFAMRVYFGDIDNFQRTQLNLIIELPCNTNQNA